MITSFVNLNSRQDACSTYSQELGAIAYDIFSEYAIALKLS